MRNNGQCISYSEFFFSNSAAVISQQHGVKFKKIFQLFHDGGRYEMKELKIFLASIN